MTEASLKEYVTVQEIASALKISRQRVHQLLKEHDVPKQRLGTQILILKKDAIELFREWKAKRDAREKKRAAKKKGL